MFCYSYFQGIFVFVLSRMFLFFLFQDVFVTVHPAMMILLFLSSGM